MLKYTTAQVTFREIPDEITLCINISNCPIHCPDCHSKELWEDIGTELNPEELERLIETNKGITCVCFMGGDSDYKHLGVLIRTVAIDTGLKIALYSGRNSLCDLFSKIEELTIPYYLSYLKIGNYIFEKGGLDSNTTNQHLYKITDPNANKDNLLYFDWEMGIEMYGYDITYKFWKKD